MGVDGGGGGDILGEPTDHASVFFPCGGIGGREDWCTVRGV